jgi:hypothetical protein
MGIIASPSGDGGYKKKYTDLQNAIYNALVAKGITPASKSQSDLVNAINNARINPTYSVPICLGTRLAYNNSPRTPVTRWYTLTVSPGGSTWSPKTVIGTGQESGYSASAWIESVSAAQ